MTTENKNRKIGLSGFIYLYFVKCRKDFAKSLVWSLIMTAICSFGYYHSSKVTWDLLLMVLDINLRVAAPILAFTLAGYSVIMGKASDKLKTIKTKSGLSMYQKLNTTFMAMLLSTMTNLLLTVLIKIWMSSEINIALPCDCMEDLVNNVGLFMMTLLLFYMIFTIKDLLSNLFSLGQFIQYKG